MQITLMRHGSPQLPAIGWVAPRGMKFWIEDYDNSGIQTELIPENCFQIGAAAKVIATSTFKRAVLSAGALGLSVSFADEIFAEADLPFLLWRAPLLPPKIWAILFRCLWFLGYSREVSSRGSTKLRAATAANWLISASKDGPVLLIGHGIMNRFIGNELRTSGWKAASRLDSSHWGITVYSNPAITAKSAN